MSRRSQLFVGRLPLDAREKDVEALFDKYGSLLRCDMKFGTGMAYAFVDYEDKRDAEDAIRHENGRELHGQPIVVEWARGPMSNRFNMRNRSGAECYRCHRYGHWARDCPESDRDRYHGGGGGRRGGGGGYDNYYRPRRYQRRYSGSRSPSPGRGRYRRRSRTPSQVRSPSYNRSRRPKKGNDSPTSSRSRSGEKGNIQSRSPSKSMSRSPKRVRSTSKGRSASGSPPPRKGRASRSPMGSRSPSPKERTRPSHSASRSRSRSREAMDRKADRSASPEERMKDVENGASRGSSVDSRRSRSRSPGDN